MGRGDLSKYELYKNQVSDQWGFKITTYDCHTFITGVFEHTPAAKAGVGINDVIVSINHVPCENISHDKICQVIQQANCHMVLVTRRPRSDEASEFVEITRNLAIREPNSTGDNGDAPKNYDEVKRRRQSKPKESLEDSHWPIARENGEDREKTSSKRRPKSMSELYEIKEDESKNNMRRKRTQYEQKKRQIYMDAKRPEDHLTNGVVEDGTIKHAHRSKGVDNTKTHLSKKKSKHLYKSKAETDMDTMENCRSSTVIQQEEEKVEDPKPPFPSMSDLQRSLPAGKRRTLLLSTGRSLEDRIASLNDL
ncbi:hypothetical protein TSMEX_002819 [Taenia solium]|eukprot:TsM_000357700 transcript=TsM_000357700 gene=TsM_000357700